MQWWWWWGGGDWKKAHRVPRRPRQTDRAGRRYTTPGLRVAQWAGDHTPAAAAHLEVEEKKRVIHLFPGDGRAERGYFLKPVSE